MRGGLVHRVCRRCGNRRAMHMVSDLQRLATRWLCTRGCSVGIDDCAPDNAEDVARCLDRIRTKANALLAAAGGRREEALELLTRALTDSGTVVAAGLDRDNMFANLVRSGSKGSVVNLAQVMGCVGQQTHSGLEVADNRMSYHTDDRAKLEGFCHSSFYSGLDPTELFMHTVSGREGLIDTAVKTSSTGYVQRRIIKSMEPVAVAYDLSVRRSANRIVQPSFGGNGLSCERMKPVRPWELDAPAAEVLAAHGPADGERILQLRCEVARNRAVFGLGRGDLLCPFDAEELSAAAQDRCRAEGSAGEDRYRAELERSVGRLRRILGGRGPALVVELCLLCAFSPRQAARKGVPAGVFALLEKRVAGSLVDPGENIGTLSSVSIGEPITQMTLNSVDYNTHLVVRFQKAPKGVSTRGCIGAVVDALLAAAKPGEIQMHPNDTAYLPLPPCAAEALTVDENGRASWEMLEAVTRHPPINKDGSRTLLKVTTESGRSVVATKAKSFLVVRGGKLVDVAGEDLRLGDPMPVIRRLPAPSSLAEDGRPLTARLGRRVGEYLRGGGGGGGPMSAWCNREEHERRVPAFAFDAPAPFVEALLSSARAHGGFRSRALAEGLALLSTRVGGPAGLAATDGRWHFLEEGGGRTRCLRDVFLDPVASIEAVESSHPHVYDLTVAKTRNMVTESGLVQRDTFHSAGLASVSVTQGVPRFKEFMDATKKIKTPFCHARLRHRGLSCLRRLVLERGPEKRLRDLVSGHRVVAPEEHGAFAHAVAIADLWEKLRDTTTAAAAATTAAAAAAASNSPFIVFDLRDPARLPEVSVVLGNLIGGKFEVVPCFPSRVCVFWKNAASPPPSTGRPPTPVSSRAACCSSTSAGGRAFGPCTRARRRTPTSASRPTTCAASSECRSSTPSPSKPTTSTRPAACSAWRPPSTSSSKKCSKLSNTTGTAYTGSTPTCSRKTSCSAASCARSPATAWAKKRACS